MPEVQREISIDAIKPRPNQRPIDEDVLTGLEQSIRTVGVLNPIIVRELGDDTYEMVEGERRLRAAKSAELTKIPAIVRVPEL